MNSVTINGKTYKNSRSIQVVKDRVIIDGKDVAESGMTKDGILEVRVVGVVEDLTCDVSVTAGTVRGDIQAGGSVTCDSIGGDIQCGGSVTCGKVSGDIMAGGSVSHG